MDSATTRSLNTKSDWLEYEFSIIFTTTDLAVSLYVICMGQLDALLVDRRLTKVASTVDSCKDAALERALEKSEPNSYRMAFAVSDARHVQ